MRAFVVALVCSGALLSSAAFADPAQTDSMAVPSASAQQSTAAAPATAAPVAATPAPTATAAAAGSAVNLDEVVCRTVAAPTGSRLGGGRECHTVREWNQRERDSQELTRENERRGFKVPGG